MHIDDFAHLEIQADSTTQTRQLVLCVKDFFEGKDITRNNYTYGLNSKSSIKVSSLQMIDKGYLFEKAGKKSIWILQDSLFSVLSSTYGIDMQEVEENNFDGENKLFFIVVKLDLNREENRYVQKIEACYSTSPKLLQEAISNKESLDESELLDSIKRRIKESGYHEF